MASTVGRDVQTSYSTRQSRQFRDGGRKDPMLSGRDFGGVKVMVTSLGALPALGPHPHQRATGVSSTVCSSSCCRSLIIQLTSALAN